MKLVLLIAYLSTSVFASDVVCVKTLNKPSLFERLGWRSPKSPSGRLILAYIFESMRTIGARGQLPPTGSPEFDTVKINRTLWGHPERLFVALTKDIERDVERASHRVPNFSAQLQRVEEAVFLLNSSHSPMPLVNWIYDLTQGASGPDSVFETRVKRFLVKNKYLVNRSSIQTRMDMPTGSLSLERLFKAKKLICTSIAPSDVDQTYVATFTLRDLAIRFTLQIELPEVKIPELFSIKILTESVTAKNHLR